MDNLSTSETQYAWAIDINYRDIGSVAVRHGLLGRFYDFGTKPAYHPYKTRIFDTRIEARMALRYMKDRPCRHYPNAKVVKVRIDTQF